MKSERRHELHHNLLAEWLVTTYAQVKPYQNVIFGAVLLVAVAYVAYTWWGRQSAARAAGAWLAMSRAVPLGPMSFASEAEAEKIIQQYPGTPAAQWAAIAAADRELAMGSGMLFTNKPAANEGLGRAADLYRSVLNQGDPMVRQRAMFGLARTLECQNKLEEAEKYYDQLVEKWPKGAFTQTANERLASLKKEDTKKFYDDFEKFKPKPATKDLLPESKPLDKLPENPPDEPAEKDKGAKPEKSDEPAANGEKPSEKSAETPAEKTDESSEKSSDKSDKPAEKEKSGDDKKATEKE